MRRVNTFNDVATTGRVQIDTGDSVQVDLPVSAAASAHTHTIPNVTGLQAALDAKARKEPTPLGTENLDTVIDDGPYVQTSSVTATAARNYPANSNGLYTAGLLQVVSHPGDYLVFQRFTSFNGLDMFWRARYGGTWYAWTRAFRAIEATAIQTQLTQITTGTGWRILPTGAGVTSGQILVKRTLAAVKLRLVEVQVAAGSGSVFLASNTMPVGFRHTGEHWFMASARPGGLASEIGLYSGSSVAWVRNLNTHDGARPTGPINGEYSWDPIDAYPTTVTLPNA